MDVFIFTIIICIIAGWWGIKDEERKKEQEKERKERLERLKKERDAEVREQIDEKNRKLYQEKLNKNVEYEKNVLPSIKKDILAMFIEQPLLIKLYYDIIKEQEKFDFKIDNMYVPDKIWKKGMNNLEPINYLYELDCHMQKSNDLYSELNYYKEKGKEILKTKNRFKTLFWDFLLSDMENGKFEIFKSAMLIKYQGLLEYYEIFNDGIYKLPKYKLKELKKEIITFLENDFGYIIHDGCCNISDYIEIAYKYAFFIYTIIDMNREMEKNKDLVQIYHNLKKEGCEENYIQNKIYSLYKELYINKNDEILTKEDIKLMLLLNNEKNCYEKNKINIKDKIVSKYQLIEIISNNLNGRENENSIIICIANILRTQKDMDENTKFDILQNIDEILKEIEIRIKIKRKKIEERGKKAEIARRKKEAEQERDRLLKGDLSKEKRIKREKEELSLSTDNIKDGFEFEEYVARLYKKLGYRIEEVTKKSGDQRSRCYRI